MFSHDLPGFPLLASEWGPQHGIENCNSVPFSPSIRSKPTSQKADSPSGLDVELAVPQESLSDTKSIASADLKKVTVALPEGLTINPAAGEGLAACSPAQYAAETAFSAPGEACPAASKLGTVEIDSPLVEKPVPGALYLAAPHDNPFDSLLALYIVAKLPERGILVKAAGRVEANPSTGQLISTFDDLPQLPFSHFRLHFREGTRPPLVTPRSCGSYDLNAELVPWSAADPDHPTAAELRHITSSFEVASGPSGPCPSAATPPFHPGLSAGSLNNAAGHYSPFNVQLTRADGEQEFTNFSIKLPPGLVAKLAGLGYCPDAAIEAAKSRTGSAELASPSCPASSQVGRTLVGAGVGSVLTYVPGKVYYAGPYHGAPISIVAITAAKVGPFDLGTVVVREALRVNPETAEIFIDATGSDPIPHIIAGIPVHARDIRVYTDRPEFVLNPTDCDPTSTASTVLGSGLDFASPVDDLPVTVSSPFQAADCAALPFKPRLRFELHGTTARAGNPALKAILTMKPGEANIARARVSLPRSEFLDNSHIGTVCTRVQFSQGTVPGQACPPASVYGRAKAYTPILDTPLSGPVYLRSNPEHELPDLLAALHSTQIDINVVGHIDSVKGGGIRNTFEAVPDAPVSRFVIEFAGGRKGLLENSTNLCRGTHRASAQFTGHNGKIHDFRPKLRPTSCAAKRRPGRHGGGGR